MLPMLIGAGASLLGGILGSKASSKAAKAQLQAAQQSNALQKEMFDIQRADMAPWREAGSAAIGQINALLSNPSSLQSTPGYQFRFDQGQKALDRSAVGRGGLFSGRAMMDAQRFGQGFASNELADAFNRYAALAGLGQTSAANSAMAAGQYGQSAGNTLQNMGNASAAGTIGQANSWNNALSQLYNQYQFDRLNTPGGMGYGGSNMPDSYTGALDW